MTFRNSEDEYDFYILQMTVAHFLFLDSDEHVDFLFLDSDEHADSRNF